MYANPNNTSTHRQCSKCKKIKELNNTNFYIDKSNKKWGYSSRCAECHRACSNVLIRPSTPAQIARRKVKYSERRHFRKVQYYKSKDKGEGRVCDLTLDFMKNSLESPCIYCGFPSTGLDRIDNSLGHTMKNCVPACKECNTGRMDNFTHEEMFKIGKVIREIKLARFPQLVTIDEEFFLNYAG